MVGRMWGGLAACVLVAGLVSCGDDTETGGGVTTAPAATETTAPPGDGDTTTAPATEPSTTTAGALEPSTTLPAPEETLAAFLAAQTGVVAVSDPVDNAGSLMAVFSRAEGGNRSVAVARFDGVGWYLEAEVALPAPNHPLVGGEIPFGEVTGDGIYDYLVAVEAAGGRAAVLVSVHSGDWALVPVGGAGGEPYVGLDPQVIGGGIIARGNDCDPSCAQGSPIEVIWRFADGYLVQDRT